jgi:hypothetical protein
MNTAMRAILIDPPTKYAVANQPDAAITGRIHYDPWAEGDAGS